MVHGWSGYWHPRGSGLCFVQLAVLLTTHRGSHQVLSLIAIKENLLPRHHHWNLNRHWSGSNLLVPVINSNRRKPPLTLPLLESGSSLSNRLLSTCLRPIIGRRHVLRRWRDQDIVLIGEWWHRYWNQWWLDVWSNGDVEVGINDALILEWSSLGMCRDHVTRSCKWSHVEIIWLVALVAMTLQLPSLLDARFVEHESCLLRNGNLVKNLLTNEV